MNAARSILVLDPSLGLGVGHHAPLARSLAAAVGGEIVFAGARRGAVQGLGSRGAFRPAFAYQVQDAFRVARHASAVFGYPAVAAFVDVTRRFRLRGRARPASRAFEGAPLSLGEFKTLFGPLCADGALRALLTERQWRDVVSIAADPAMLAALAANADSFARAGAPNLHLIFMYPERDYLGARTIEAHALLVRELLSWPRPPRLYAELEEHVLALQSAIGAPVSHQILPYHRGNGERRPCAEFSVAVLGAGRADKGFAGLIEVVNATRKRAPEICFRIQGAAAGQGLEAAQRKLETAPNVTLLAPNLDDAAYEDELARASVVLLAYDPDAYARRGSGVFIDAVIAGTPIVCVADTAIARALTGNGLAGRGAEGLADAIVSARAQYDGLSQKAALMRMHMLEAIRSGPLVSALNDDQ